MFGSALAIQTAFEFFENTCMRKDWWESQKPIIRSLLMDRMQGSANVLERRAQNCLTFTGVNFDEWEYLRHEYVNVT